MNLLEVLKRIRSDQRTRGLPVVILTSSNDQRDIISSYDLGANSFLQKPLDFAQFWLRRSSWALLAPAQPAAAAVSMSCEV